MRNVPPPSILQKKKTPKLDPNMFPGEKVSWDPHPDGWDLANHRLDGAETL